MMKKIISATLALLFVLTLCMPAFAAEEQNTDWEEPLAEENMLEVVPIGPEIVPDEWEEPVISDDSGNDTWGVATPIVVNQNYSATTFDGDDVDWYTFTLPGKGTLSVDFFDEVIGEYPDFPVWTVTLYVAEMPENVLNKITSMDIPARKDSCSTDTMLLGAGTYYIGVVPYYINRDHPNGRSYWYRILSGVSYRIIANYTRYQDWIRENGKWYYYDKDGNMQIGWFNEDGNWYYFGTDGALRYDWQFINDFWYYLGSDGVRKTGWQWIDNWFYFDSDGKMATNWLQNGGKWYYMGSGGAMRNDWQYIGSSWYYFAKDGALKTGWQWIGNAWYNFHSDGKMRKGWHEEKSKWYYFANDGRMAIGTITIGGEQHNFASNGVWQGRV